MSYMKTKKKPGENSFTFAQRNWPRWLFCLTLCLLLLLLFIFLFPFSDTDTHSRPKRRKCTKKKCCEFSSVAVCKKMCNACNEDINACTLKFTTFYTSLMSPPLCARFFRCTTTWLRWRCHEDSQYISQAFFVVVVGVIVDDGHVVFIFNHFFFFFLFYYIQLNSYTNSLYSPAWTVMINATSLFRI